MKIVILNLISIIRKFKVATLLNVLGLSAAFAAFLIILMHVTFEYSYESYHPHADRIYRVERVYPSVSSSILTRPFVNNVIESSPLIEAGTILCPWVPDIYFTVTNGDTKKGFTERIYSCYPDITKVFRFEMVEGDVNCLNTPGAILIPESMARKIFGKEPAVNQIVHADNKMWTLPDTETFIIGGVYKDFPGNTQLRNAIYAAMNTSDYTLTDWNSGNYYCYLLLDQNADPEDVAINFDRTFDYSLIGAGDVDIHLGLNPLKNIYFGSGQEDANLVKTGNRDVTRILFLIAVLVLAVAAINYTNFSTSLAPMRVKSINTQKVFGSPDSFLRTVLLAEAVFTSFIAYLVSLGIVWTLNRTGALPFMESDLSLVTHPVLITITGILSILVGIVAGMYPAYYITSFQPAMVLKGAFGLSPAGRKLRTGLIGFQFIVSIILIIGAIFIHQQNVFMKQYKLGFDTDQIAIVKLNQKIYRQSKDTYATKLKSNPGIQDVAFSAQKFGGEDTYRTWGGYYREELVGFYSLSVSYNFLELMGIPLLSGTSPSPAHEQGNMVYMIPNRSFQERNDLELNSKIEIPWMGETTPQILAFTDDYNFTSLRQEVTATSLVINDWSDRTYSYIRMKAGSNIDEVVKHIRTSLNEIEPAYPVEIEFFDTVFNSLYQNEQNMSQMILLFSLLAIILSLVGIFGLVIFDTYYRYKEIGVRKVHGASIRNILWIFNKYYSSIVIICFIIAAPIAWYTMNEWLKSFAYKTPMHWWVFVIALLVVTAITVLTVTFQSWRAANSNPVESINTE